MANDMTMNPTRDDFESLLNESMGGASFWTPDLTGTDKPEKLWARQLTSDIFPMLGVAPAEKLVPSASNREPETTKRGQTAVITGRFGPRNR